jgi:RNA polymerase sigma factor (sigma-70 family)
MTTPWAGSITRCFGALQGGDRDAAQQLWERYFRRLIGLARKHLQQAPRRVADEEDVALSAFDSFCRGVELGRFCKLEDRDDLWQLLVVITVRKAADQAKYERRQKRSAGAPPARTDPTLSVVELEEILGREPTPEVAALAAEEYRRLMSLLDDDELRAIALLKMEGYTNDEISQQLGCVRRTVQRRLRLIQDIWSQEVE